MSAVAACPRCNTPRGAGPQCAGGCGYFWPADVSAELDATVAGLRDAVLPHGFVAVRATELFFESGPPANVGQPFLLRFKLVVPPSVRGRATLRVVPGRLGEYVHARVEDLQQSVSLPTASGEAVFSPELVANTAGVYRVATLELTIEVADAASPRVESYTLADNSLTFRVADTVVASPLTVHIDARDSVGSEFPVGSGLGGGPVAAVWTPVPLSGPVVTERTPAARVPRPTPGGRTPIEATPEPVRPTIDPPRTPLPFTASAAASPVTSAERLLTIGRLRRAAAGPRSFEVNAWATTARDDEPRTEFAADERLRLCVYSDWPAFLNLLAVQPDGRVLWLMADYGVPTRRTIALDGPAAGLRWRLSDGPGEVGLFLFFAGRPLADGPNTGFALPAYLRPDAGTLDRLLGVLVPRDAHGTAACAVSVRVRE